MTEYMEYIKGGDILIAPSLNYKHQYILKCGLCEEYYGEFQIFFSHYMSHYDMESSGEGDILSHNGTMDEEQLDGNITAEEDIKDSVEEAANQDVLPTVTELISDSEEEVKILAVKEEIDADDEIEMVKKPTKMRKFKTNPSYNSNDDDKHKYLEIENLADNTIDITSESGELVEETHESEQKSCEIDFVKNFMKSKENLMAFIAAYKKQSHLWNLNHPVRFRKKPKLEIAWMAIAEKLYTTRNINISINEVAAIISHLRQKYREKKANAEYAETPNNAIMPLWVFDELSFLNKFVDTEPIAILDAHQDLSPQQITQILEILERCPHLWDSNTIEFYCTNKRKESIAEMRNIISEEMDLDVDECTLQKYVQSLQEYFVIQKRRQMGFVRGTKDKSKYFQNMIFLYDHLGPYQCSYCRKKLYNTLQFKVHKSQHDGTVPLNCYLCNKDFKIVETYVFHIRRHMDDLNQECKECGKKFLKTAELNSHMRSHTGDRPYFCDICHLSFSYRTALSLHKKQHNKKYIQFCPYCSKGFYSKCKLDDHIRTHKDERVFACPLCGKSFKTKCTLRSHVPVHENGSYLCQICGKTYKNKINLRQHKRTHKRNFPKT